MAIAVITRASGGLPVKDLGGPGGMAVTEVAPALGGIAVTKVAGAVGGMGVTFVSSTGGPAVTYTKFSATDLLRMTVSADGLTATGAVTSDGGVRSVTSYSSGKYYWEVTMTTWSANTGVGIATASAGLNLIGPAALNAVTVILSGQITVNGSNTGSTLGARASGNVIGISADFTNKRIWLRAAPSGNWNGSGTANPDTAIGGISFSGLTSPFHAVFATGPTGDKCTSNFGASAFVGAVPSGFTAGWPA